MIQKSRMVILGHTGFLGNALYRYFEKSAQREVFGLSSAKIDLRDPKSLLKLEEVVNEGTLLVLASAITRDREDSFSSFTANLTMTHHVAQFLETHPRTKCIYLSSIAVYGDPETNLAVNEETSVQPDSYYALAKYAGESILQMAAERAGFSLLIVRASRVYGPGDTHSTYGPMKFIQTLLQEGTISLFGEGEELRDHLYIDDFVRLTDRLVSSEAAGTFNLVTGKSHTFSEIVQLLRSGVPKAFRVIHLKREKLLIHQQFDTKKLLKAVPGFQFTDLQEGLQKTLAYVAPLSGSSNFSSRRGVSLAED